MNRHKSYRPLVLLLIFVGLVVFFTSEVRYTFTLLQEKLLSAAAAAPREARQSAAVRYGPLYPAIQDIDLEADGSQATALDGMSLQEIAAFRAGRVARYAFLNVFPSPYQLLQGTGAAVFKNSAPGAAWSEDAAACIANPYSLVIVSCAGQVMPLNLRCRDSKARYSAGRIEETLGGESADCFFDAAYDEGAQEPGTLQVSLVNAYDSGFHFATIDTALSQNIGPGPAAGNIYGGICSYSSRYLVEAGSGKNTIHSDNPRGVLVLQQRAVPTKIAVKLWRNRPRTAADRADFVYSVSIEP